MDEVDQKEVRIIISRVPDENRRNYWKCLIMDTEAKNQYTCCIQESQPLCYSSKSKGDTSGNLKRAKLPGGGLSFAKTTSLR